jgi:arylsulfatase A-like enzyme
MELTAENGFASYERGESNLKGVYGLSEKYTPTHFTGDIGRRALKRLMDQPKPWFLTLSFKNPHPPFVTPWFPYMEWYWQNRDTLFVPPSINDEHMENSAYRSMKEKLPGYGDPIKVKEWMAIYYAMIEEIDYEIDGILSTLGDAHKNTLIIFTSDHGEMLGAHGKRSVR